MLVAVHHALLGLAVAALLASGLRVATRAGARGLERVVAAAPLAAAAAGLWALGLGLVGLGASPAALCLGAAATFLAASRLLPGNGPGPLRELSSWWSRLSLGPRVAAGAAAGASLALVVWLYRYPYVGVDGIAYHLRGAVDWVHSGRPGAEFDASYEFPIGSYPLTNELLISWAMGISRSFAPATLSTPAALGLTALAAWVGLRSLRVPRLSTALAAGAVCTLPLQLSYLNEPNTDTPALAWLACASALAAASARRPALLVPAVVATGLAVGTKTTTLPLAALALAAALYARRSHLRRLAAPLSLAAVAALAVGGTWYVRNLLRHGSPFWPFLSTPWSDDPPRLIELLRPSLLDRPRATLEGRVDAYVEALAGGLALAVGGLLAPLLEPARAVVAAAAAAGAALLLFASAPATGIDDFRLDRFSISALRYSLPALAACALALALAARRGGRGGALASGALAAALVWNLVRDAGLGFPSLPSARPLLAGAAIGAAAAVAVWRVALPPRAAVQRWTPAALAAGLGVLLAWPASGYVERHSRIPEAIDAGLVRWFTSQPAFDRGRHRVAMVRMTSAMLAGDRLRHEVALVPHGQPCAAIGGPDTYVVMMATPRAPTRRDPHELFPPPGPAERCAPLERPAYVQGLFAVYRPGEAFRARGVRRAVSRPAGRTPLRGLDIRRDYPRSDR